MSGGEGESPRVIDVSGRGIGHIGRILQGGRSVAAITADRNKLSTLNGIERYPALIQLSVRDNCLVRMDSVASLVNLDTLNLQSNSITEIAGLEGLVNLRWLCLAGNSIEEMKGVSSSLLLGHLDLSENCISQLTDISMLTELKTLLLHGNAISTLRSVPHYLPHSLVTLTLAENEITDLNEVSFLSTLKSLMQLSIMGNPCVSLADSRMLFDYRPYVLYWCSNLSTLDGILVTVQERQQSLNLFPPGQNYPFSLGQHHHLVQYLASVCSFTAKNYLAPTSEQEALLENLDPNQIHQQRPPPHIPTDGTQNLLPPHISTDGTQSLLPPHIPTDGSQNFPPPHVPTDGTQNLLPPHVPTDGSQNLLPPHMSIHDSTGFLPQEELMQKLKALRVVQQMIAVQEKLLQQQAMFDSSSQGRPVDTTLTERLLQQQAMFDSSGQGRPLDTTLTDQPLVVNGTRSFLQTEPTHTWTDASQTISESQIDTDPTLPSEVSSQCSSLNILPLLPLSASDTVDGTAETTPTGDLGATVEGRVECSSLEDERRNQLQLLNRKIARGRLQEEDVSLEHLRKKKGEGTLDGRPSVTVSHPRTSIAAIFPAEHGITHTSARIQPETTDVSKKVSPLDYRLPGVPSYVQPPVPTSTTQRMLGQMSSTAVPSTTSISVTSSTHAPSVLSASSFLQYGHLETLTHTSTLDDVSEILHDPDLDPHSMSSYLPVPSPNNSFTTGCDVTALAASLSQAYGMSSPGERSQLLSTLMGTGLVPEDGAMVHEKADGSEEGGPSPSEGSPPISDSTDQPRVGCSLSTPQMSRDSAAVRIQAAVRGYLYRKRLGNYLREYKAATLIQAAWRGHHDRRHNPAVVQTRHKLKQKKMEDYVATLYVQLQGCREELAHQAHVVQLQEETIKSLLLESESLRQWREQEEGRKRNKAAIVIQKHWRGHRVRKDCDYVGPHPPRSSKEALWSLCLHLKQEVEQLQASMESMMGNIYVYGETRQRFLKMGFIGDESLPAPSNLRMTHFSDTCVLLQWSPQQQQCGSAILQGFRVYVNGIGEGTVGHTKNKAYIEGLDPSTTYRITVRAVYTTGESPDSEPIVASLAVNQDGSSEVARTGRSPRSSSPLPGTQSETLETQEDGVRDRSIVVWEKETCTDDKSTVHDDLKVVETLINGNDDLGDEKTDSRELAVSSGWQPTGHGSEGIADGQTETLHLPEPDGGLVLPPRIERGHEEEGTPAKNTATTTTITMASSSAPIATTEGHNTYTLSTSPTDQPDTAPTDQPHTSSTDQPETSPTDQPRTSPTDQPGTSPTDQPGTSPTDQPGTSPTDQPGTSPTDQPDTSPTDQPGTSSTDQPYTSPTDQPGTSSTDQPYTSPTDQPNLPYTSPTDQPNLPYTSPTDQPNLPGTSPTDQPNLPYTSPTDQPNPPGTSPTDQPNLPYTSPTDQPNLPYTSPTDQPNHPGTSSPQQTILVPLPVDTQPQQTVELHISSSNEPIEILDPPPGQTNTTTPIGSVGGSLISNDLLPGIELPVPIPPLSAKQDLPTTTTDDLTTTEVSHVSLGGRSPLLGMHAPEAHSATTASLLLSQLETDISRKE